MKPGGDGSKDKDKGLLGKLQSRMLLGRPRANFVRAGTLSVPGTPKLHSKDGTGSPERSSVSLPGDTARGALSPSPDVTLHLPSAPSPSIVYALPGFNLKLIKNGPWGRAATLLQPDRGGCFGLKTSTGLK